MFNVESMLIKLLRIPTTLRIKLYPHVNRMILRMHGAALGENVQIPGKVFWQIGGVKSPLGEIFISPPVRESTR